MAFVGLHPRAKRVVAAEILRRVRDMPPRAEHAVRTDNAVPFTPRLHQFLPDGRGRDGSHRAHGVAHRLAKPAHPWTMG